MISFLATFLFRRWNPAEFAPSCLDIGATLVWLAFEECLRRFCTLLFITFHFDSIESLRCCSSINVQHFFQIPS